MSFSVVVFLLLTQSDASVGDFLKSCSVFLLHSLGSWSREGRVFVVINWRRWHDWRLQVSYNGDVCSLHVVLEVLLSSLLQSFADQHRQLKHKQNKTVWDKRPLPAFWGEQKTHKRLKRACVAFFKQDSTRQTNDCFVMSYTKKAFFSTFYVLKTRQCQKIRHLDSSVNTQFCADISPVFLSQYWAVQAGLLTPLTFARHHLSPLAAFTSGAYFLHNGSRWQWICEFYTANFKDIFGGP